MAGVGRVGLEEQKEHRKERKRLCQEWTPSFSPFIMVSGAASARIAVDSLLGPTLVNILSVSMQQNSLVSGSSEDNNAST